MKQGFCNFSPAKIIEKIILCTFSNRKCLRIYVPCRNDNEALKW